MAKSPVQAGFERRARRHLAVLAYHGIEDPETFASHLDFLVERTSPVGLQQVAEAVPGGSPLPPRAVLVTFDDGDRSVLDVAAEMLVARRIPAVAFVCTGVLGSERPLWWVEVAELGRGAELDSTAVADLIRHLKRVPDDVRLAHIERLRSAHERVRSSQLDESELRVLESLGIVIGNHTVSHPCLPRCADEVVEAEVRSAHERLTSALGHPPAAFAYPNGDWDRRAERVLTELGYEAAFLFDHHLVARPSHPLRMSRIRVDSHTPPRRFELLLSGLHPAVLDARRRWRSD